MSFLAGRLAATEGSYFLQQSKQAVSKLLEKQKNSAPNNVITPFVQNGEISSSSDVLPEVLRHSLPAKIFTSEWQNSGSSSSRASKWALKLDPKMPDGPVVLPDALHPLRASVSLPQVSLGAKRWQLPNSAGAVVASTANELRQDKHAPINPEKLKAAAAGLSQIGSGFAVATVMVFGGATVIFGLVATRYEIHDAHDIKNFGKDVIQPKFQNMREHVLPLRTWVEAVSKKWRLENERTRKESPLLKELARTLGVRS